MGFFVVEKILSANLMEQKKSVSDFGRKIYSESFIKYKKIVLVEKNNVTTTFWTNFRCATKRKKMTPKKTIAPPPL